MGCTSSRPAAEPAPGWDRLTLPPPDAKAPAAPPPASPPAAPAVSAQQASPAAGSPAAPAADSAAPPGTDEAAAAEQAAGAEPPSAGELLSAAEQPHDQPPPPGHHMSLLPRPNGVLGSPSRRLHRPGTRGSSIPRSLAAVELSHDEGLREAHREVIAAQTADILARAASRAKAAARAGSTASTHADDSEASDVGSRASRGSRADEPGVLHSSQLSSASATTPGSGRKRRASDTLRRLNAAHGVLREPAAVQPA